jgi:hypothetical protein
MKSASHKNLSREQRLAWARGILAEHDQHSDARVRRACKTVLNHAPSYEFEELLNANVLLDALEPAPQSQEATS